MAVLESWLRAAERVLWGPGTLALLLGTLFVIRSLERKKV